MTVLARVLTVVFLVVLAVAATTAWKYGFHLNYTP